MTTLVQNTRCGSFQNQDWCWFHWILYLETCSGNVPLPLGEGGAKRRVRAGNAPSSGPLLRLRPFGLALRPGHLLPEGEGHEPRFRLIWTPVVIDRPYSQSIFFRWAKAACSAKGVQTPAQFATREEKRKGRRIYCAGPRRE